MFVNTGISPLILLKIALQYEPTSNTHSMHSILNQKIPRPDFTTTQFLQSYLTFGKIGSHQNLPFFLTLCLKFACTDEKLKKNQYVITPQGILEDYGIED